MDGLGGGVFPDGPDLSQGFGELVPVDAFFDNYVHQLESVAASAVHQPHNCAGPARRQQATLQHMTAEANHYQALLEAVDFDLGLDGNGNNASGHHHQQGLHNGMLQLDSAELDMLLNEPLQPIQTTGGQFAGQQANNCNSWNCEQPAPAGRGSQTGGSDMVLDAAGLLAYNNPAASTGFQAGYASGNASNAGVGKPATSTHSVGGSDGGVQVASSQQMDVSADKPKRRRVRTEHQQEQNKLAQKRYRERKKQKAQHLEMTVEELAMQAEEMQRIKEQNKGLQTTKAQLESELLEKEAQIKRLNEELESSKATQAGGDDAASGGVSENNMSTEDLKGLWHAKMDEIRNIYEYNNLESAKLNGEGVSEEVLGTMSMLVEEVISLVRRLTRIEGLDLNELVNADPKGCDHLCDEETKEIWTRVAAQCELNGDQVAKVRVLRAEHLRKLEAVYNNRQKLNLDAISVLLPPNVSRGGGHITCMSGLFSRNRNNDKLARVLNLLKENLKEEQRLASELEYIVLHRLLTPLQAVAFMLEAYPCYCDCLALLNGAYQVYCLASS